MKSLPAGNYTIRPFEAHKPYVIACVSGTSSPSVQVSIGVEHSRDVGTSYIFTSASADRNPDGTYLYPLFDSVKAQFYYTGSLSGSSTPVVSGSNVAPFVTANWGAGGSSARLFYPTGSIVVINVPQRLFGEFVRPGSFVVSGSTLLGGGPATASIVDDGSGRLYISSNPNQIVGNIFYGLGIAVIKRLTAAPSASMSIGADGIYWVSGSSISLGFDSTQTIYEHQIAATIDPMEYNYSFNPSASGSCLSGQRLWQLMLSGSVAPYLTSVGLYTDKNELVAVAKFPHPIRRSFDTSQTFIVRFDY